MVPHTLYFVKLVSNGTTKQNGEKAGWGVCMRFVVLYEDEKIKKYKRTLYLQAL
jgi:hypothetical protein